MERIIVTRFSAMGDVAMVASVLKEFQQQHSDTEVIVVTRRLFADFFGHIPRVIFHEIDPTRKHKGATGLFRLYRELRKYKVDYVADLHNNIRSRIFRFFFKASGVTVRILDKGREEKKALLLHTPHKQLRPTTERYADVFRTLGFDLTLSHRLDKKQLALPASLLSTFETTGPKIGIAPFAQHPYKVFPLTKMEQVIAYLSSNNYQVFIFGGGAKDQEIAEGWSQQYSGVTSTIGQYSIDEELHIISHLDLMISMDSSGMHMASLVGTRCLSIWGATHPYAGFLGYGQQSEDCIQVEHPNRPSSIYGNKPCDCDGIEAIDLVSSEMVIDRIKLTLDH